MKNRVIQTVILSGSIAILAILAFQIYWLTNSWRVKEQALSEKINIVLRKAAQGVAQFNQADLPLEDLIHRRSTNYYIVNINDVIDANVLEHHLRTELGAAGLKMDFEYAIYNCETDEMQYGDYCSISSFPAAEPSSALPKYDKFTYYFGVRFPQVRNAVLSEMNLTFVLSGLLLTTLLFFAYALYVILSQKRFTQLQKEFINNMTHEFKTPISSIRIGAKTFLENGLIQSDERLHKYAEIMYSQAGRLNEQVEKILDLARLEKDQFKLKKDKVDLHKVLGLVYSSYHDHFLKLSGQITLDLQAERDAVHADPLHLTNVLYNLIDNSIKYAKEAPLVSITTRNLEDSLILSVRDNGIGISKSEQQKIFDKFYRVPTGNIHNAKGFGLGLYYVRQICKLHGWHLQMNSEQGVGTEFTFKISLN